VSVTRVKRAAAQVLAVAAAVGYGCGCQGAPPAGSGDCGAPPAVLEVGSGRGSFTPVADGDRIYVVCGSQGGKHVDLQLRAIGVATRFRFAAMLTDAITGLSLASTTPTNTFVLRPVQSGCQSETLPLLVQAPGPDITDRDAVLDVRITDETGETAVDSRRVVIDTSRAPCVGR